MTTHYILSFICYFALLLSIGYFSHRKQTSNAEFIVGNRSLNFWVTALSAHASDMSAWLFMGLPMAVYLQGLSGSWIGIGLLFGMFFTWQFIATKLRNATEQYDSYTLSTFFEKRFNDHTGQLRILTAAVLLFFLTFYLGAGLTAMGLLIESLFHIDYFWGLSFALLVVVIYTFGGGFITIAWTDLFQGIFLLFMISLVPLMMLIKFPQTWETIAHLNELKPGYLSLMGEMSLGSVISSAFVALSWGLGYFGMPHVITKFLGIKHAEELSKSRNLGMAWQFFALTAAIAVGVVGFAFFQGTLANPELVFVEMVKILFHPFLAGFVLCGVLAANLSTMDSQLLVCASVIGEDLYKRFYSSSPSQKNLVRASRIGVLIIAFLALLIAFRQQETIIEAVFYAWAGLGSAFGPLVLMSLYDPKANKHGALCGIIVGGLIGSIWPMVNPYLFAYALPATIPGFSLSLLAIYGVSRLTQGKEEKI
jgi:solute:Na+ symporter, SSS family